MIQNDPGLIDHLISEVTANAKYRTITPDLIRSIGAKELAQNHSFKEAVKATRSKLHQIGGSYQEKKIDYARFQAECAAAVQGAGAVKSSPQMRQTLSNMMKLHASTRERLPILAEFYDRVFKSIGPIHSIVDLACGLNPLAAPWMPLAPGARYIAIDIYQDMVDFLNQYFSLMGINGYAQAIDLFQSIPPDHFQVALLLKTLPCLEQVDKTIGQRLLESIQADFILVSYPVASLGGRAKGMRAFYADRFQELARNQGWAIERIDFSSEVVFVVTR